MEFYKKLLNLKVVNDGKNYSHVCFPKFVLKDSNDFLKELEKKEFIEKVWEENNFINIIFNKNLFNFKEFVDLLTKRPEKKEKVVLIEHTSNNPTGPLHIGRVRSTFIGDFLSNALEYLGYNVKRHFYVNDLGKQIAQIFLARNRGLKIDPKELKLTKYSEKYLEREDYQTSLIYIKANEEYKNNQDFQKEVDSFLKKVEENEELLKKLKETAEFALKGIRETFKRLNIRFDSFDFESSFLKDTKNYLNIIARNLNLKEHPYIIKIKIKGKEEEIYLTRKDGTTTYLSRDIAYHKYKEKLADELINVLGEDHKREFLILKELLKIVGFKKELDAVFFSFITLEGKKLSTRKGNIVTVDELIDMGKEVIKGGDEQKEKMAITAFKVYLLKMSINKPIDFKWKDALSVEGETGIYLQYSLVRAKSILKKSKKQPLNVNELSNKNLNNEEMSLIIKLSFFDYYLEESVKRKNPALFLNYLFELSKAFNNFYSKFKIIGSEREEELITIINLFVKKMEEGFRIINIPVLEKIEKEN